jgi:hypothetical protein
MRFHRQRTAIVAAGVAVALGMKTSLKVSGGTTAGSSWG